MQFDVDARVILLKVVVFFLFLLLERVGENVDVSNFVEYIFFNLG